MRENPMNFNDKDAQIYAEWILENMSEKSRDFLEDLNRTSGPPTGLNRAMYIHLYAMVV